MIITVIIITTIFSKYNNNNNNNITKKIIKDKRSSEIQNEWHDSQWMTHDSQYFFLFLRSWFTILYY